MFKRLFFAHSPKTFELFHFPMFQIWTNLTRPLLTNGPQQIISEDLLGALALGSLRTHYGFRSLEAAALVLRVARSQDSRLDTIPIDKYLELIKHAEDCHFTLKSFEGKAVVALEGLDGAGKSALSTCISNHCDEVVVLSASTHPTIRLVQELFHSMPEAIQKAFEFANNYILAMEIVKSEKTAFFIDGYYHTVCCRNVCEVAQHETAVHQMMPAVFEWPYELPQPDLVLFLSVTTSNRLKRLRNSDNAHHSVYRLCTGPAGAAAGFVGTGASHSRAVLTSPTSSITTGRSSARTVTRDAKANLVYSLIKGPGTIGIDANPPFAEVVATTLEALDYYGVYEISRNMKPLYIESVAAGSSNSSPPDKVCSASQMKPVSVLRSAGRRSSIGTPAAVSGILLSETTNTKCKQSAAVKHTSTADAENSDECGIGADGVNTFDVSKAAEHTSPVTPAFAPPHLHDSISESPHYMQQLVNLTNAASVSACKTTAGSSAGHGGGKGAVHYDAEDFDSGSYYNYENDVPNFYSPEVFDQQPMLARDVINDRRVSMGVYGMFSKL